MAVRGVRTLTPAVDEYVFDLDGGRLCLDFVNTHSQRTGEHLRAYADLLAFARQSGVLTPAETERLKAQAARQASEAAGVLRHAHALRGALFGIFSAVARGRQPPPADLERFNAALGSAMSHVQVTPEEDGFGWGWAGGRAADLEAPVWEVLRSAADLLTSPEVRKVRECGGADCRWLFMDTSKNRSRQWCSMQSCGNREKARRHYERTRAKQQTRAGAAATRAPPAAR